MKKHFITACAALAMAGLGSIPAYGQATTGPSSSTFDFAFPVFNDCTGEIVDISGQVHFQSNFVISKNGDMFRFHIDARGNGVGQDSGISYIWSDQVNENYVFFGDVDQSVNRITVNTKMISSSNADNSTVNFDVRFHTNANGDVTVDEFGFSINCSG